MIGVIQLWLKHFDRLMSIIRKIQIIGADSALVYTLIHTILTGHVWDRLTDRTFPLRLQRVTFVQNYSRVRGIPNVGCCASRAFSYFSIGESRLKFSSCLFTLIRLPLYPDRFTIVFLKNVIRFHYAAWQLTS